MVRFLLFIFFITVTLIFFIFTLENLDLVPLNLVMIRMDVPLGLTLLLCFILGAVIGVLFSATLIFKNKNKARMLAKKVALAEEEVANLRQLPIKSSH